jgi:oxygen-independent coproporphyrinogen-3 oxidase
LAKGSNKIGLYVHIPFCQSKCRYCSFYSVPVENAPVEEIIRAEIQQLQLYKKYYPKIETVYIGGGSPSVLEDMQLAKLIERILSRCRSAEEITVEVNPGQVSVSSARVLKKLGVNRISIGGQSFNQKELDFLGRGHTVEDIYSAVGIFSQAGFDNLSLDVIFAVCGQSLESWKKTLKAAVDCGVRHISAYSLSFEAPSRLESERKAGLVEPVSEQLDCEQYIYALDFLESEGFGRYEISNFAKQGFECRHNLNYWANGEYIGLGPGAWSYIDGVRSMKIDNIPEYIQAVSKNEDFTINKEKLTPAKRACETAVLNLRRKGGLNFEEFQNKTGFNAEKLFSKAIGENTEKGFLEHTNSGIALTEAALAIADSVLCDFT